MNYYNHLVKLNNTRHGGDGVGLARLVILYNLCYLFQRPFLVKMLQRTRFQDRKKLLYTVLTGSYDTLNEVPAKLPGWDYICFTDNDDLSSATWEIRRIDSLPELDSVRLSRYLKINNHLVDTGYELSVYVDANIRIRGDLDAFLGHAWKDGSSCSMLMHPFLHSLEEEVEQCIATGKDEEKLLRAQYRYYTEEKEFADTMPHVNARLLIRRVGNTGVQKLMETWFEQLLRWSRRDQLGFNYALSRCPDVRVDYIPYWIFRRYFKRVDHR
jgi:hypothetical protein